MHVAEQRCALVLGRSVREARHGGVEQLPGGAAQLRLERLVAQLRHDGAAVQRRLVNRDLMDRGFGVGEGGIAVGHWRGRGGFGGGGGGSGSFGGGREGFGKEGGTVRCRRVPRQGDEEEGQEAGGGEKVEEKAPVGDGARGGHCRSWNLTIERTVVMWDELGTHLARGRRLNGEGNVEA